MIGNEENEFNAIIRLGLVFIRFPEESISSMFMSLEGRKFSVFLDYFDVLYFFLRMLSCSFVH